MASVRKGVPLKLGLISALVRVETAVESDTSTSLSFVCNAGHPATKTRQTLHCPTCQASDRAGFVKGKVQGDQIIVVDEATLEAAAPDPAAKNSLDVTAAPADEVARATVSTGTTYYLVPERGAEEAYGLFVRYLTEHPEVALLTVFAPRTKASMYRLGTYDGALTITQLAWPAQVKVAPVANLPQNDQLYAMAEMFVAQLTAPFDPTTFTDRRAEVMAAFLAAAEGTPTGTTPAPAPRPTGPTLQEQLAAALAASQAPPAPAPAKKPRKKAS